MASFADRMNAEAIKRKAEAVNRADEYRADKTARHGDVGFPGQGDVPATPAPQIPVDYSHLPPQSAEARLQNLLEDRYGVGKFRIENGRVIARNFDGQSWDWRDVGAVSEIAADV